MYFIKILLSAESVSEYSYSDYISIVTAISILAGLGLFIYWAAKTRFGKDALRHTQFRANTMPYYLPFAVILGWLLLYSVSSSFTDSLTSRLPSWQQKLVAHSAFVLVDIVILIFILAAAKKYFVGGLYGFGLRAKGIFGDIIAAAAYFLAVWPLVMTAILIVLRIGRYFVGPEFEMQQNEALTVIIQDEQLPLRILMIFFAAILTPIFEECIFRGLLQSYMRDLGFGPWRAILITSIVFAVLHPSMHWPGILILSLCMGYAYEKSGSLLRPMFIHFLFNSTTIAFALLNSRAI